MAEDRSRYYKIKLLDPFGKEISERVLRIYPEDEQGEQMAKMQGAMLGQEFGIYSLRDASGGK